MRYLEDFAAGDHFHYGPARITREGIIAFAREWDPQRFHLSDEGGRESIFGELIASGAQTILETVRLYASTLLVDCACQGSPGLQEIRFLQPVRPGDELSVDLTVTGCREHPRHPSRGAVDIEAQTTNQDGAPVLRLRSTILMGRRGFPLGN